MQFKILCHQSRFVFYSKNVQEMLKGGNLKIYSWFVQSELYLVKHGQKSKVRTVLKLSLDLSFSKLSLLLIIGHVLPEIIHIEYTKGKTKMGHI